MAIVYIFIGVDSMVTSLFVYGTLRSGFDCMAFNYIAQYFTLAGPATTRGILYDLGDYPAAMPADEEIFIAGELYELKAGADFEHAIQQPDEYEGANPMPGEPRLYRREVTKVWCSGETKTAWIYWYDGAVEGCKRLQSGDYMDQKTERWK